MTKLTTEYNKELKTFNDAMQYKLHVNRHKGKWEDQSIDSLFDLLLKEVEELRAEINTADKNQIAILLESADVGVFAMMIANVAMRTAVDGDNTVGSAVYVKRNFCDMKTMYEKESSGFVPFRKPKVDDQWPHVPSPYPTLDEKPIGTGMMSDKVHSKPVHPFNLPFEKNNDY